MNSEADLDERTADQLVVYEAVALMNQATLSPGQGLYTSSFSVCPENISVSSAHLQTVAEITSRFTEVSILSMKRRRGADACALAFGSKYSIHYCVVVILIM